MKRRKGRKVITKERGRKGEEYEGRGEGKQKRREE